MGSRIMEPCIWRAPALMLLTLQLTRSFIDCSPTADSPSAVSAGPGQVPTATSPEGFLLVGHLFRIYKIPLPLSQNVPYLTGELETNPSNATSEAGGPPPPTAVLWKSLGRYDVQSLAADCVKQHVYWGTQEGKIYRSDYDGQNVETVITDVYQFSEWNFTLAIFTVDTVNRNIFWFQGRDRNASIAVANLDNIQAGHSTVTANIDPTSDYSGQKLAVDPRTSTIYWAGRTKVKENETYFRIFSVNMDGTNVRTVADRVIIINLFVDVAADQLCYAVSIGRTIDCLALGTASAPREILTDSQQRPTGVIIVGDDIYYSAFKRRFDDNPDTEPFASVKKVSKDGTGKVTLLQINEHVQNHDKIALAHVPQRCPTVSQRNA